ncbi:MAG: HTH domain-containing protein [Mariniphaga sp.]|nr:HTH domain-containing protein [Mariniphaga sp.]
MMKDNENITIAELTEAIGVSSRSIERNIKARAKLFPKWEYFAIEQGE